MQNKVTSLRSIKNNKNEGCYLTIGMVLLHTLDALWAAMQQPPALAIVATADGTLSGGTPGIKVQPHHLQAECRG